MVARPGEEISGGGGGFGGWEGGPTCTCPGVWRLDAKRLVPDNPKLSEATLHPAGRQLSHAAWEWAVWAFPGLARWRSASAGPIGRTGDALRSRLG